jgi:hypothetical protein
MKLAEAQACLRSGVLGADAHRQVEAQLQWVLKNVTVKAKPRHFRFIHQFKFH